MLRKSGNNKSKEVAELQEFRNQVRLEQILNNIGETNETKTINIETTTNDIKPSDPNDIGETNANAKAQFVKEVVDAVKGCTNTNNQKSRDVPGVQGASGVQCAPGVQGCKDNSVSPFLIEKFVKQMLEDPNINCDWLWDPIERRIYTNVFLIMLRLVDHILDTTSIQFLGHTLTFDIRGSPPPQA